MSSKNNTKKLSTLGFIMSSIGAAVGLGNIWRFPKEMVTSGGSSFILIYVIVLFFIAFPIILLEMQYGLFFKKGVVSCFENVNKRFGRFFGWKQIMIVSFVCVYYLAVLCWVFVGLINSLIPSLFKQWGEISKVEKSYFDRNILQLPNSSGIGFSYFTLIAFFLLIVLLFFVMSLGIKKGLEKINLFLVPGLFFLLISLTIYTITKNNAIIGIKKLFEFKKDSFLKPLVWYKASIQSIFSLGIMFGTFIVLTKSSNIKIDKGNDALIIVASDSFIGILSGILITTTVASGYSGNEIEVTQKLDDFFNNSKGSGGSELIFEQLPKIFYQMESKILGQILFAFFIISLLFAAFSSIIVLLEVFIDSILEQFPQINRRKIMLFWGFFAILQYLVYVIFNQKKIVEEQDKWINQLILFVGVFEIMTFILFKGYKKIIKENEKHTYLKMSPFNWLKKIILFVTIPLMVVLCLFGFIKLFDLDLFIFENQSEYWKNLFDFSKNRSQIIKEWKTPERVYTICTIIFMVIMSLLLTLISKKTKLKDKK